MPPPLSLVAFTVKLKWKWVISPLYEYVHRVSSKYFVLVASFYWLVVHESLLVSEAYCFRTEV